jgi:hypothetical protein
VNTGNVAFVINKRDFHYQITLITNNEVLFNADNFPLTEAGNFGLELIWLEVKVPFYNQFKRFKIVIGLAHCALVWLEPSRTLVSLIHFNRSFAYVQSGVHNYLFSFSLWDLPFVHKFRFLHILTFCSLISRFLKLFCFDIFV